MSTKIQELEQENEALNNRLNQTVAELQNRDNLSYEWENTINSVTLKIQNLEKEN